MAVRHLVTARELERMGRADLELVRGELVPVMTPAGEQHGTLAAFLTAELWAFVRAHDLGRVYVEVGYKLFSDPDTVRGPDVSFVSRKRQTTAKRRRGFIHGAGVRVHQPGQRVGTLSEADALDGVDVLPGFTLPLWRRFAELDG